MRIVLLRSLPISVICFLILTLSSISAVAQTQITSGTIQGTVVDANGAYVPGATVEIKEVQTNFTRNATTDEDGRFVALLLPSGKYTITIAKSGFTTVVVEQADLSVGQTLNLQTVALKVSGVEERVTITAVPTIDITKTESSTNIDETVVTQTPILGRKFEDLLTLTPNVSIVQGPDGDEINFAGQRGFSTTSASMAATTIMVFLVNKLEVNAPRSIFRWMR